MRRRVRRINREVCVFLYRAGSSGQLRVSRCCRGGLALLASDWLPALTAPHMIAGREAPPLSLFQKQPFINYTSPAHSWVWKKSERGHGGENNSGARWVVTDDVFSLQASALEDTDGDPRPEYESTLPCWKGAWLGLIFSRLLRRIPIRFLLLTLTSIRCRSKKQNFDYTLFLHGEAFASGFTGKHWIRQLTATLRCTARTSAQTWSRRRQSWSTSWTNITTSDAKLARRPLRRP